MDRLSNAKVAVFGIGGVGGYVVEALARSGVGSFVLVDDDKVCLTNINRQIIATRKTVGKYKVDVMKERILEINPDADIEVRKCFYLPENAHEFPFEEYSYVVDAVDTVTAKIEIVMRAKAAEIPVISCMGAGNKLDASTETLLKKYIDQDMPVVFWACINMRKEIPGPEWKLLDTGERFCWTSNEHCMLLVGYDEEKYYFNDPYDNNGVVGYPRTLVEKRHAAQRSMALGVLKR